MPGYHGILPGLIIEICEIQLFWISDRIRVPAMKAILSCVLMFSILTFTSGCPSGTKDQVTTTVTPVVNGVISCVKAEQASLAKNISVLQIGMDVAMALMANKDKLSGAVDDLIAKYKPTLGDAAESVIACSVLAFKNGSAPVVVADSGSAAGSGSAGSGSDAPKLKVSKPTPGPDLDALIAQRNWKFQN